MVCDSSYMLIGGVNGSYVVSLVIGADEEIYTLKNTKAEFLNDEIDVVTGGQRGSFPPTIVTDYDTVIKASHYFFENQDKNPLLSWIREE